MSRYTNTVYTFVLPENTSDLPHEMWIIALLQTLDVFIKRRFTEVNPAIIVPEDILSRATDFFNANEAEAEVKQAKDHIYVSLIELISDEVLHSLTLYNPYQVVEPVTAYRIIESNNGTWVKLYVRNKQG